MKIKRENKEREVEEVATETEELAAGEDHFPWHTIHIIPTLAAHQMNRYRIKNIIIFFFKSSNIFNAIVFLYI